MNSNAQTPVQRDRASRLWRVISTPVAQYPDGALLCPAALVGMYIMKRRRQQRSSKAALAKGGSSGEQDMEAGNRGGAYMGDRPHAQPDQDKVAAMLASMRADAARTVSKRQPPVKEDCAGECMTPENRDHELLPKTCHLGLIVPCHCLKQ